MKTSRVCLPVFGLALLTLPAALSAADVVINEVLYNLNPGDADARRSHQWIELYNKGPAPVNLAGWVLANRFGNTGAGARSLPAVALNPGAYLVLHYSTGTPQGSNYYTGDPPGAEVFGQDDGARLYNGGVLVDSVTWSSGATPFAQPDGVLGGGGMARLLGSELAPVMRGSSIGRNRDSHDFDRAADWGPGGGADAADITPGAQNLGFRNLLINEAPRPARKPWTVLFYMSYNIWGEGMQQAAWSDLKNQIAAAPLASAINVVVMLETNTLVQRILYTDPLVVVPNSFGNAFRFQIRHDDNPTADYLAATCPPGENPDLGKVNMGDPATLSGFIAWAKRNYPADHYALVFKGHGAGWKGLAADFGVSGSFQSSDALQMNELSAALNGNQFDVVSFDMPFMASIEVANQVQPYVRYMVASEDVTYAGRHGYNAWLAQLHQNPAMTALDLAGAILGAKQQPTVSRIRADAIGTLVSAVSSLGSGLADATRAYRWFVDGTRLKQMWEARADSPQFTDANYLDLYQYASLVRAMGVIPRCYKESADTVLSAVRQLVFTTHPWYGGISIYYPRRKAGDNMIYGALDSPYDTPAYEIDQFGGGTGWFGSRETSGNTPIAIYAANRDLLPKLNARETPPHVEQSGAQLSTAQSPRVVSPNLVFAATTAWPRFLQTYYRPLAHAEVSGVVVPPGQTWYHKPQPELPYDACGAPPHDEVTVPKGSTVTFSNVGSFDVDYPYPNMMPVFWDFDDTRRGCTVCRTPYQLNAGEPAENANDGLNDDQDENLLNDEKDAAGYTVSHRFDIVGTFRVYMHVWDNNHTYPLHDTLPNALYVHPQSSSDFVIVNVVEPR